MSTSTTPWLPPLPHNGFECRVIADSIGPHMPVLGASCDPQDFPQACNALEQHHRLTTLEITFPRFVLAEFNTHRQFSRNSASSRAIPVRKQLEKIRANIAMPVIWQANQSGMQGGAELTGADRKAAQALWIGACTDAVSQVESYLDACSERALTPVHKQIINRLLEPFMWHTVIVTATEWSNFFALRCTAQADPNIAQIALMMREALAASQPESVDWGAWHLPLLSPDEKGSLSSELAVKISSARCARVSYLTHDGARDLDKDLELYERLVEPGHMSPLEHAATPYYGITRSNFNGWLQHRKMIPGECR